MSATKLVTIYGGSECLGRPTARVKAARTRFARRESPGEVELDPELDAELRALGYL